MQCKNLIVKSSSFKEKLELSHCVSLLFRRTGV